MPVLLQALHAQTAPDAQAPQSFLASPFFMIIAMLAVFYFIIWRPQSRERKKLQEFVAALKKGDEVVTQSGIIGIVHLVEDRTVTLDVGGGTKLRILKGHVAGQWKPVETAVEAKK